MSYRSVIYFFLVTGPGYSFRRQRAPVAKRQNSRGTNKTAPSPNVNFGMCQITLTRCLHSNGLRIAALPHRAEGQQRAAFHRASTHTETHTNQITPKQHYNACESSLFTHTFTIESLLCILNKIRYILPQSTDVLSFLHHSAIWIWWGSAPRAPNVETPLTLAHYN